MQQCFVKLSLSAVSKGVKCFQRNASEVRVPAEARKALLKSLEREPNEPNEDGLTNAS